MSPVPRSFLFVPGDSERKMAKALASGADALILDLEDAVAAERLPEARALVHDFLLAHPNRASQQLWVRINPLSSPLALADLVGVIGGAPDGIVLPKPDSGADLTRLGHYLDALEAARGLSPERIAILPIATETARAMFAVGSYAGATPRLTLMTWGAEDIAAAVGASGNRDEAGQYDPLYELARTLCVAGAAAAEAAAIDTVFTALADLDTLESECRRVRRMGFQGKLAIHPAQVPVINRAFAPSEAEIAFARRVVEAFAADPTLGVVTLDGKMIDMPHLKQAQKLLVAAGRRIGDPGVVPSP